MIDLAFDKKDVQEVSRKVDKSELSQLYGMLSEKNDKIRYPAFLILQSRSQQTCDVYPFFDSLCLKLKSENSYHRSIGLMLIAENARWDKENKLEAVFGDYIALLNDEKPITVRQCIESLGIIAEYKPGLRAKIGVALGSFDILKVRETMQKSIKQDIEHVMKVINMKK
ncbi:MAG: hypothetical protein Q8878_01775 [Bacillota bacterium]|nr:hypothetical protein [Bacillota bacterium]